MPVVSSWMRALTVAALSLLVLGCEKARPSVAANPTPQDGAPVTMLEAQRDALARAYRLTPDQRFLIGFSVVHAVLTGEPRTAVVADFSQGAWHLRRGTIEIGSLPELPTWGDAFALLVTWSASLLKSHPVGGPVGVESSEALGLDDALSALEAAQGSWSHGEHTTTVMQRAARALVSLALQTFDDMEMADEISGRAVALTAVVKALGGDSLAYEVLLAKDLGYWGAGRALAAGLPANAARAFVLHDDELLTRLAEQPGASEATRGLLLRRYEVRYERARERQWISEKLPTAAYSLPVLFVRLFTPALLPERELSAAMPHFVLLATLRRAGDAHAEAVARELQTWTDVDAFARGAGAIGRGLGVEDSELLNVFEAGVAKIAPGLAGVIFDARTEQMYFRAAMYSALSSGVIHTIYHWNSMPAAKALLARWGTAGGAPAADFRLWASELIDAQSNRRDPSELLSTMKDLPAFGAAPVRRLYDELAGGANWGDPRVAAAAKALVARMDTRLSDRRTLFYLVHDGLHDMVAAERIGRTLLVESPPTILNAETYAAWLLRDVSWYKARLADPQAAARETVPAIVTLESLGVISDDEARAQIRARLAPVPAEWPSRTTFIDYLFKKQAFDEARAVAQDWLAHNPRVAGVEPIRATAVVARTFHRQGKDAEAWKILEPVVSSQVGDAMSLGAFVLDALGRADDAEKLAQQVLDRYPTVGAMADLADLYWRHRKDADAAKLFAPPRVPTTFPQMRLTVGPAFVRAFDGRPPAEALSAFRAMSVTDPHLLREVADWVDQKGQHQLAFDMEQPLSAPGMENLEFLMRSFAYLDHASGHAQAVSWLKSRVPPQVLEPLCIFAFRDSQDELLWEMVPTPAPSRKDDAAETIWLYRTAALVRGSTESHRAEVLAHYQGPAGGSGDVQARYLLGMVDEKAMFNVAKAPRDACETAFWLGYKAQVERRFSEASQWYRVADESGLVQAPEYRLAHDKLYGWYSQDEALSLLPGAR